MFDPAEVSFSFFLNVFCEMLVLRGGAKHHREGLPPVVGADQLRVVQRPQTSGLVLPDDPGGVRPPAHAAEHDEGGGGPVVRLLRGP